MWFKKKKAADKPAPRYAPGFLPRDRLRHRDALRANMNAFEKTNYRCMCFSNNEGDDVWFGELLGFVIYPSGAALPVVRSDDGKELVCMGFVLPWWDELAEFLQRQESRDRFWRMATLMHGWSGLKCFDQIVYKQNNKL